MFKRISNSIHRLRDGNTGDAASADADGEPFPGYDRTDELELIDGLHLHTQTELEAVEAYERSHRSRTRVLNKVHYLRQSEPIEGYDDFTIEEIAAALDAADLQTIKNIRAYERKFHNRPAVQRIVEEARRREDDRLRAHSGGASVANGLSPLDLASREPGPGKLQRNKALATSFYADVVNAHNLDSVDRLVAEDFVHNGEPRGRAGQRAAMAELLEAIPDLRTETILILAEGDLVSAQQRWTGTHLGAVAGIEATGRPIELTSTAILRIHDGLISEAWDEIDLAHLLAA